MDTWTAVALLVAGIGVCLIKYIDVTRDVPQLYLAEQSIVEDGRRDGESAIHRSNKLDYGKGLRVGLDIRYDSYKMRHGNLRDIYEIWIKKNSKAEKSITINGERLAISEVNFKVDQISKFFRESNTSCIRVKLDHLFDNVNNFALIIACFVNQIPLELYQHRDLVSCDEATYYEDIDFTKFTSDRLLTFENCYSVDKDKGIALTIFSKLNHQVKSKVEFTQLNLVSAVASTLRHLPLSQNLSENDTILISRSEGSLSNEEALNVVIKVLASFISNSSLIIVNGFEQSLLEKYKPTILSINQQYLPTLWPSANLGLVQNLVKNINLLSLSFGKFPVLDCSRNDLRLVYVNKNITERTISATELRAFLKSRVVIESGYYGVAGPILLTDFYDYRKISVPYKSYGCISQSLELKLANYNQNRGYLMVRGYNIAKATTTMNGNIGESASKNSDGFMPLLNVNGSWGKDGCLYIQ
jgi:hypothetical protein